VPNTPVFARVNRGKGHSYTLNGQPVPGVTTLLGDGLPKPALVYAARTQTAAYVTTYWDELAKVPVGDRARKIDRDSAAEWRTGSTRGTKVHEYAARLMAGETVDVPDEYVDVVDQCLAFLADWDVHELHVERPILNATWRYAGTVDLIAQIGADVWLLDWKTGRSGIYPDAALQLSAYANAEWIYGEAGELEPMPKVARAAAVWLRADGYEVHELEIGANTFASFLYVREVANWCNLPREELVGPALPAPEVGARG
jgi:hypothetical protein